MAFIVPLVTAAAGAIGSAGAAAATAVGTAATAATAGSLFSWGGLGLLGSVVSGVGSIVQGMQQADAYRMAATGAIIEGNQRAMEYQRQGIQVMRKTAETEATVRARAGAGGVDPFSGSAGMIGDQAFTRGGDEYGWARENAAATILSAQSNAAGYRSAARSSQTMGIINGLGSIALGAGRFGSAGGFKSLTTPVGKP